MWTQTYNLDRWCNWYDWRPIWKIQREKISDEETLIKNQEKIKSQFEKFLNFSGNNSAKILNNITWFKKFNTLEFLRKVGKHISVNYMMARIQLKIDLNLEFHSLSLPTS